MIEEKKHDRGSFLTGLVFIFPLLIGLILFSCHTEKPPPPPEDHYDPRNISRRETASGGPKIGIDPLGTTHVVWIEASDREWMWSRPTQIYYVNKAPGVENGASHLV